VKIVIQVEWNDTHQTDGKECLIDTDDILFSFPDDREGKTILQFKGMKAPQMSIPYDFNSWCELTAPDHQYISNALKIMN
jgi:hypothetical protein